MAPVGQPAREMRRVGPHRVDAFDGVEAARDDEQLLLPVQPGQELGSRSQVPSPPACLMKPRICCATSGGEGHACMSGCVRPSRSVNRAVTRNSGGRSCGRRGRRPGAAWAPPEVPRGVLVVGAVGAVHGVVPVPPVRKVTAVVVSRKPRGTTGRPPRPRSMRSTRSGCVVDAGDAQDVWTSAGRHRGLPCRAADSARVSARGDRADPPRRCGACSIQSTAPRSGSLRWSRQVATAPAGQVTRPASPAPEVLGDRREGHGPGKGPRGRDIGLPSARRTSMARRVGISPAPRRCG